MAEITVGFIAVCKALDGLSAIEQLRVLEATHIVLDIRDRARIETKRMLAEAANAELQKP